MSNNAMKTNNTGNDIKFIRFPTVSSATDDGLLAMGGELDLSTLVSAYSQGIFPWFNDDQPVLWWSPDPRMVLYPSEVKISRSLRKKIRKGDFHITCNQEFNAVINACALRGKRSADVPSDGTWITNDMQKAYSLLHNKHYAHSIEVWMGKELVGGLYGVALGNVFFGESMFSRVSDASKVALITLSRWLENKGFEIIDCQVASEHLFTMGAREIRRKTFLNHLTKIDIQKPNINFSKGFKQYLSDSDINTA